MFNFFVGNTDKAPMELIEFIYRREMGYTPEQMDAIPTEIIERDLLFMRQEGLARKVLSD